MGLFDRLFGDKSQVSVADGDIVAIADGELIDVHSVSDNVFASEMMGKSCAFRFDKEKVTLCSPVNGTLTVMFPTGHAFGITGNDGVEIIVHCGIDTVSAKGAGFHVLKKKQGDTVRAGDPIVEVDVRTLSEKYDMSTILIITKDNGRQIEFIAPGKVEKGQSLIRK
ncbi:MAG: PTS glucose transporter subunit IIA [Erysipelotrichaceae bacterium]|nr:PTS glucose transporter subunit IIA [Erysipelotrichaceae bacterium]